MINWRDRECRVLWDAPIGGGILADLQEIRELRDEVLQYQGDADALTRELRRSQEELTERTNAVATVQKATEMYSLELTAAQFNKSLFRRDNRRMMRWQLNCSAARKNFTSG